MSPELQSCPVCGVEQPLVPHYPDYLCRTCVARAATADGRLLAFYNTSVTGGFVAKYADTDDLAAEETVTHEVYVDGLRCRADAGRFGGIVLQPWPDDQEDQPDDGA
jgi:hypothetical protein